jgi:hypothetical protein
MISMTYDVECVAFCFAMRNIPFAFGCLALVEAGCATAIPPLSARCRDGRLPTLGAWRSRAKGAQKLRKEALKIMKSLARINLCEGASALLRAVKSGRTGPIFPFLVNQTFRKPYRKARQRLTPVALFYTMNKTRTLCGEFQAGLFVNNAVREEGLSAFGLRLQKRSARC